MPSIIQKFKDSAAPHIHLTSRDLKEIQESLLEAELNVVILDGSKMRDSQSLFREFADKLQFPDYFGFNWDAFDECIADLDWLGYDNYVVVVNSAFLILNGEKDRRSSFFNIINDVGSEWAEIYKENPWFDYPKKPIPFHVILVGTDEEKRKIIKQIESENIDYGII